MKKYSVFRAIFTILVCAVVWSGLMIMFSPGKEYAEKAGTSDETGLSSDSTDRNVSAGAKKIIGIIPGHYGFDSGYQCEADFNFVKESNVNLRIAVMVRDLLLNYGYSVDLLNEFDPRLSDYTGLALVTIHADSCSASNSNSGFHVTAAGRNSYPAESKRLRDCLSDRYAQSTGLPFLGSSLTQDNPALYSFDTVNDYTTISVINPGYLNTDYRLLSEHMDQVAQGIANGVICYVENESIGSSVGTGANVVSAFAEDAAEAVKPGYILPLSDVMSEF